MERMTADRIVAINVDVQNDFLPGGPLAITRGNQVIKPLNDINEYVRSHGGSVVFTGDQHPVTTPHFDTWPIHCVAGTEGAALSEELTVLPEDMIIRKGTGQTDGYSAFEGSTADGRSLESIVTPHGNERVVVLMGGLATDYCVLNSALDALRIDQSDGSLRLLVMRDAVRGVNLQPHDSDEALRTMQDAGAVIIESADIIRNERIIA
jgi:nicotinamidase/pyrazinamidase